MPGYPVDMNVAPTFNIKKMVMELTIKIQIGCEAALMEVLRGFRSVLAPVGREVDARVVAAGLDRRQKPAADNVRGGVPGGGVPGGVPGGGVPGDGVPGGGVPTGGGVPGGVPGGGVPGDMNVAPTPEAPAGDASAEVRKILAATRKRFGAVAGTAVYRKLNEVLAAIAMDLGGCTPPKLPAEKVEAFHKACEALTQGKDGMPEYIPF